MRTSVLFRSIGTILLILFANSVNADLIVGWDFQTTTNGGTATSAAPNSPLLYNANFGSGALFLNGTNGSSAWTSLATNPQVTSFGGTAINGGTVTNGNTTTNFSTTTTGTSSLALANSSANGQFAVFAFNMTGFQNLDISYATQRTATGFTSQVWDFSTDGTNWTNATTFSSGAGLGTIATSFANSGALSIPTITALDNVSTAFMRLTVSGATAVAGNNRFDNFQFNAQSISAVPEPSSIALFSLAACAGLIVRLRRNKTSSKKV